MTKTRTSIPQASKVRAELQKEANSECPFCGDSNVGHFEIHHMDENPSNHDPSNLILLCRVCHSKIGKKDISAIDVLRKKLSLTVKSNDRSNIKNSTAVNFNGKVSNAVVGDHNTVVIKKGKTQQKYPPGCIGYETDKANYIGYLIDRYQEYKKSEVGSSLKYPVFYNYLKRHYKLPSTRTIYNLSIDKFDDLVLLIHGRIQSTRLAKMKGKNHRNFSSFEEYLAKQNKAGVDLQSNPTVIKSLAQLVEGGR